MKKKYQLSTINYQLTSGFTIIEFLIYMGIFSMLLLVLLQIFTTILDLQLESQATSSIFQDGQFILERLRYDLKRAESLTEPATLGGQSNNLQITINGQNLTYSLNSNNLVLTDNTGSHNLNSFETIVSNLNFKRLGQEGEKDTVSVSFTLTSKTQRRKGPEIKNFQTTIGLR